MTPGEHVAAAEASLGEVVKLRNPWSEGERLAMALTGLTHACIAIAIELGAPHVSGDTAAASSG